MIQERAVPLLLEGKDVLVRARTGSGKTAAFSIPVIQKILNSKQTETRQCVKALILAPSKELCTQVSIFLIFYVGKHNLTYVVYLVKDVVLLYYQDAFATFDIKIITFLFYTKHYINNVTLQFLRSFYPSHQ